MYIIIIGCGEIGAGLAMELAAGKDDVVVIDHTRESLAQLGTRFNGRTIVL